MAENKCCTFFRSWRECVEDQPAELRLEWYEIILDYLLDEKLPSAEADNGLKMLFKSNKPVMEKSLDKYHNRSNSSRENGKKGGRPSTVKKLLEQYSVEELQARRNELLVAIGNGDSTEDLRKEFDDITKALRNL